MRSILELVPNSKKLLAVLCVMLVAESVLYYEVHQRHEALVKERDRLLRETSAFIKAHRKPASTKDITL